MMILSFRTKKDKEHMLEKAKKLELYASELVDCLEEAKHESYDEDDEEYSERTYYRRHEEPHYRGRYGYRK